jgi:hypothetical protein
VLQVLLDKPCGKLRRKNYAMGRRAFFGAQWLTLDNIKGLRV